MTSEPPSTRPHEGVCGDADHQQHLALEIVVEDGGWADETTLQSQLAEVVRAMGRDPSLPKASCEAVVVFTTDAAVRTLNRTWRGKDKPTNVLSFPAGEAGSPPGQARFLGDIVLAGETTRREADEQGIPVDHHLKHLVLHGLLHLMGYDHETEDEALVMEELETRILSGLGISDPHSGVIDAADVGGTGRNGADSA